MQSLGGHTSFSGSLTDNNRLPRNPRLETRVCHRVPCRVNMIDSGQSEPIAIDGETLNVSRTGIAVQVGMRVPEGATVEVLVAHADGAPSCLVGKVVHSRRVTTGTYEVGIGVVGELRTSDC
ncbi:MAG: PilZ domain-containing protein [Planctomycetes bacterium]|nr:PilZ domain-containing protein [Planctomycetota bacterium]